MELAERVAQILAKRKVRVVFAESCTAGLVSSTLARVPGISEWHCGSAVTYREATKFAWLGVSKADLRTYTAVSAPIAQQMATGVLLKTPEADFAASVTGHLGPEAPADLDGVVFVGVARRGGTGVHCLEVRRFQLQERERVDRQSEAAAIVLDQLLHHLE